MFLASKRLIPNYYLGKPFAASFIDKKNRKEDERKNKNHV